MAESGQAQAIPFADTAANLASDHDVLMCYQLLLGRDPENSHVIQEAKTQRLTSIFEAFVRSGEFANKVTRPFNQGEPLGHDAESLGPSTEQLVWLTHKLQLTRRAASAVKAARSWRALFAVLFTVPGFTPAAQPALPRLFGAVDSLVDGQVRGWCIDAAVPGRLVGLAMLADGEVVGRCECQLLRPDVQAAVGGDGRCGFEFEIPEHIRTRSFTLSAQNTESSAAVFGPLYVPASQTALADTVAALQERLGRLDSLMHQVAGALPDLAAELRQLAQALPAPPTEPSEPDRNTQDTDPNQSSNEQEASQQLGSSDRQLLPSEQAE